MRRESRYTAARLQGLRAIVILAVAALALALPVAAGAQVATETPAPVAGARPVAVERIQVRGASLEGNLEGNAVERDVLVFLPPRYEKEKGRHYPVVYALHGYSIGAEQWSREIHVHSASCTRRSTATASQLVRDLPGHAHEQGRRSLPEQGAAVFSSDALRHQGCK